ncbi:hypothetical protein P0L94_10355 [Microbacter sp. GSS18]|nr:hypothetical protein P0L94_10355 [Microbacter sp. GSS18]
MAADVTGVLIAEQSNTGHRLEYVRVLLEMARAAGITATILTSEEAHASEEYQRELADVRPICARGASLIRHSTIWSNFVNTWRILATAKRESSCIVIPNVDEKLAALAICGLFFPTLIVRGVVMRPAGPVRWRSWIKNGLVRVLRARGYDLRDLVSPTAAERGAFSLIDPSGLLDRRSGGPVGMSDLARDLQAWRASSPKPVVGIVGVLNERKSVEQLLLGASAAQSFRVLLAGKPSSDALAGRYAAQLSALGADAKGLLRSLTVEEFGVVLDSLDALALLYTNEAGSSGLLTHALVRGIPAIGYRNESVNAALERLGIGSAVASLSPNEIADTVLSLSAVRVDRDALDQIRNECLSQWAALATCGRGAIADKGRRLA